jgi:hypothetical protein
MQVSLANRQFNRAYISMHDMQRCIDYLGCAQIGVEREDWFVVSGLLSAAIVSYARPFSGNRDHPKATPNPSFRLSQLTPEERALHKHILAARNEAVAHSQAERNPVKVDSATATGWTASSRLYNPLAEVDRIQVFLGLATTARGIFASATHQFARHAIEVAP